MGRGVNPREKVFLPFHMSSSRFQEFSNRLKAGEKRWETQTKWTVDMYTDTDFIVTKKKNKTKHNHDHTLSYSWTYLAPLWVHSLHSLSTCERGGNAKNTQPQFRFLPWQRERTESESKKKISTDCILFTEALTVKSYYRATCESFIKIYRKQRAAKLK